MKRGETTTALCLRHARMTGCIAESTERWVKGANVRKDLFGFCDVLVISKGEIIFVQSTTRPHYMGRLRKVRENANALWAVRAGGVVEVWVWDQRRDGWYVCRRRLIWTRTPDGFSRLDEKSPAALRASPWDKAGWRKSPREGHRLDSGNR